MTGIQTCALPISIDRFRAAPLGGRVSNKSPLISKTETPLRGLRNIQVPDRHHLQDLHFPPRVRRNGGMFSPVIPDCSPRTYLGNAPKVHRYQWPVVKGT